MNINDLTNQKPFEEVYGTKLEDITISARVSDALAETDLVTVADLCQLTKMELSSKYEGFGAEALFELEQVLLDFGLTFGIKL